MDKELMKTKRLFYISAALGLFAALLIFPLAASGAVKDGLSMCVRVIIPSLFPFFAVTNLLNELGVSKLAGNALSPLSSKLFGVSGQGAAAFIIGVTGGYPLGASYIAGLRRQQLISSDEASRLLIFCNNSGPAFIIGAAGIGIFKSSSVGFFLYAMHILAALIWGVILSTGGSGDICYDDDVLAEESVPDAVTNAIKKSAEATVNICAFITAFSALNGILDAMGLAPLVVKEIFSIIHMLNETGMTILLIEQNANAALRCAHHAYVLETGRITLSGTGAELSWCRALLAGILELGNGIGSMEGLSVSPINLALAAFILSWGGLSVHFQSFAMISGTDIKTARYMIGRFLIALTATALALLGGAILY